MSSLRHNTAYHMRCDLGLACGRVVTLRAIRQWMTYGGLIEGVPTRSFNDRMIESDLRDAEACCAEGARPYLLPPRRRDYLRAPGDMQGVRGLRDEAPEWLPGVACVAVFGDVRPARDPSKDCSQLTVVWYQDEFAFPIADEPLAQLRSLDWEALAIDLEF